MRSSSSAARAASRRVDCCEGEGEGENLEGYLVWRCVRRLVSCVTQSDDVTLSKWTAPFTLQVVHETHEARKGQEEASVFSS